MGRKPKYTKEVKIKACKYYDKGTFSFSDIAEMIGTSKSVVHRWYLTYKVHGPSALATSNNNRSYSKEFKSSIIEEYTLGKNSMTNLAAQYNIAEGVINNWASKWYNGIETESYVPKGDIHTMKSRKTTFEERLEIVKWVIENDLNYKDAADKYAITYALVYKWTKAYIEKGPEALKYQKRGPKAKYKVDESNLTEVEKLKLELEKEISLRKEREFELEVLKKKEEFEKKLRSRK